MTRKRSGQRCTRLDNMLLEKSNPHQNERDPEAMQVCNCMVKGTLIRIVLYYIYQQDESSFS